MDIKYNMGGAMHIILAESDINAIRHSGFYTEKRGLHSTGSSTWVGTDPNVARPLAEVDGDRNLKVFLPVGSTLPLTVDHSDIHEVGRPAMDTSADFYFGKYGGIALSGEVKL